ncbi:MAG: hypothetical protein EA427_13035 [Spirochaetaceae bacterium]|nr:MAG: hypothetical protein EA427_13035 [Spirochaetaceae bacterium]
MSEELNGQAEQLQQTVAFFRIDESAGGARALAAPGGKNAPRIAHGAAKATPVRKGTAQPAKAAAPSAARRETGIALADKKNEDGPARISLDLGDGGPDDLDGEFESF